MSNVNQTVDTAVKKVKASFWDFFKDQGGGLSSKRLIGITSVIVGIAIGITFSIIGFKIIGDPNEIADKLADPSKFSQVVLLIGQIINFIEWFIGACFVLSGACIGFSLGEWFAGKFGPPSGGSGSTADGGSQGPAQ